MSRRARRPPSRRGPSALRRHLWVGGGIAIALDTKDVCLAASHVVGFTDYRQPVWQTDSVFIYGTAEYLNEMASIGSGPVGNLRRALEAFTEMCATFRPAFLKRPNASGSQP
jgi:hypothetical protein